MRAGWLVFIVACGSPPLAGRNDKSNDVDALIAIIKDENTPDSEAERAWTRLGTLPKEQVVPKLYTLFAVRKWKVRWTAGSLVLRMTTISGIGEFMRHLPTTPNQPMGLAEPITYGALIARMEARGGEPSSREAIMAYLSARELGPKLTALGFFYGGKRADVSAVQSLEDDKTPVPHCDKEDDCGWTCIVAKAPGSQETEEKTISTVGDFVKFCAVPSMTND